MIQKLIEPFSVIDGKIYFNREDGKQLECGMLWVAVNPSWTCPPDWCSVSIYDNSNHFAIRHEEMLKSGCGYSINDPVMLCESIRRAMQHKFGVGDVVCSTIQCDYEGPAIYQFSIELDNNTKNIKYREECKKKTIGIDEKIQKTQKLLVEKQCELVPISSEYHNLISAKNRLPFYALKQKKEYDKKIIAIKPKVNSLEDEIARLQSRIAGLIDKRNDADRAQYIRHKDANGRQYKDFG